MLVDESGQITLVLWRQRAISVNFKEGDVLKIENVVTSTMVRRSRCMGGHLTDLMTVRSGTGKDLKKTLNDLPTSMTKKMADRTTFDSAMPLSYIASHYPDVRKC